MRRKRKTVQKTAGADEKKLQSTLKRLNAQQLPAVEEANMFKSDGKVMHFKNPKVQMVMGANTFVISGANETKSVSEMVPEILEQMGGGGANKQMIQQLMAQLQRSTAGAAATAAAGGDDDEDDLDDVDFEKAAADDAGEAAGGDAPADAAEGEGAADDVE